MPRSARRLAGVALLALALSACGGGGSGASSGPTTTSPAPGANVDPNAHGYYTGPINDAKNAVNDLNAQQHQLEQQTGGS